MTSNATSEFMQSLEHEFRTASGMANRASYKIFYGPVRPAPILTLGINPGGDPALISADGTRLLDGQKASASSGYFEHGENDVLDCEWRENKGLRQLLLPLVGNDPARFRTGIVKTNLAFRRSVRRTDINMAVAMAEAAPFLARIIERVSPRLVVLTGASLADFVGSQADIVRQLVAPERDPGVRQIVFAAQEVRLTMTGQHVCVAQVAHASQFAWTYARYAVSNRIMSLLA